MTTKILGRPGIFPRQLYARLPGSVLPGLPSRFSEVVALDTETTPEGKLICVSLATHQGSSVLYDLNSPGGKALRHMLRRPQEQVVMHNAKYDLKVLEEHGCSVECHVWDTMLMAKLVYERLPSYSLKALAWHFLGELHHEAIDLEEIFQCKLGSRKRTDMTVVPKDTLKRYALRDAEITLMLFWHLVEGLRSHKSYALHTEHGVIHAVAQMERNTVCLDTAWVRKEKDRVDKRIALLLRASKKLTGNPTFNINSVKDVSSHLADDGVHLPLTPKGNPCFSRQARSSIKHPLVELKNELADLDKLSSTYYANILALGGAETHPNFEISEAATRRFSSRGMGDIKLNWQNFPTEARRAVVIPPGRIGWFVDYRQIENVTHIFFSEDKERWKAYESDEEWSEYLWLSERILGKRITKDHPKYRLIKSVKLGMNYGMGVRKFAMTNNIPEGEAKEMFLRIYNACPAIRRLQKRVAHQLARRGYVEDVFGYRYHGKPDVAYKVVAYLNQGCAAGIMKTALIRLASIEGIRLHLTVHDEVFFTTRNDARAVPLVREAVKAMTDFGDLFKGLPIRVEVYQSTTSWADKALIHL